MAEMKVMATTGMVGYGYTEEAFRNGISQGMDFIAADAGSMDPGPHYLGEGVPFVSEAAIKRDLSLMLEAAVEQNIPMLIGSAGGGGGAPQVQLVRDIICAIAREKHLHFKMAVIQAEQDKEYLKRKNREGMIEPLGPIDDLTDAAIDESHRTVAMMGVEPFQKALKDGAQVIVAGRASDAALFSAFPLMRGFDPGLAWHLSKIIECAGQVVTPRTGQDCVIGTLCDDHFTVEPGHPDKICTRIKIAAHTLYENPSPYLLEEPSGTLITSDATYEQIDRRTVRVRGSRFEKSDRYTVKLEGVKQSGFRTVFVAGTRDPILISVVDDFIAACHERVANEARTLNVLPGQYQLNIRIYGKNATMGAREPIKDTSTHELGILVDVLADDEDTSKAIMAKARYALLHTDFPGRKCISGNLAIPFSPSDMPVGRTYEFVAWHRMEIADPLEPFPIEMMDV